MVLILDGKKAAAEIRAEVKTEVARLGRSHGPPGLVAVIVGEDPASQTYVKNKEKGAIEVGMRPEVVRLPGSISQADLIAEIRRLNASDNIHGILVQQPLPPQIDEATIVRSVDPMKDVDCFHPENVGLLFQGHPRFAPATPSGVVELLRRNRIPISGREVVIVGRSNIVGRPLAALLLQKGETADATVTVCHSKTKDLPLVTRRADILVAAIGKAHFIKNGMVGEGAVVVDVGINRVPDGAGGSKIVGDVDFDAVSKIAAAISPVPGGVGPMTIAMLLKNTLHAAKMRSG
jgi:methylenetetrahydrofolate dehydrogenase (NADP+)/methenyltetrahydrofolate cyclohydrolase